ncbi:uncharacterized protein LOC136086921 [Hydra vulgaris]|uniref:Uncharacterized protein LOC136086921 n=1 Tax=Hydra vulgaris TaxID=6087 RepID=A0ABM4CU83_HYDVU
MRSWLVYLPSKKSVFCTYRRLFSRFDNQYCLVQESGFKQLKAPYRIIVHENSKNHRQCFTQGKEIERNLLINKGIIGAELQEQVQSEIQKWCYILKRLLHFIKYLAIKNMALRGHREQLQSDFDTENLLGLLKLISNFDPVLKEDIREQAGIFCNMYNVRTVTNIKKN